jgi:tetratricopeptide (TPR) repeat protein
VLGEHRRLISLVEHGGYGKSRLAIEFGWRSLAFFDDGAWLIELKDLELPAECSAAEAAEAIAAKSLEKLRLQRDPQIKTAAEQLIGRWRAEHVLLIFDNFEHVELGASVLPTLLHECGRMQIVVTSRHELGLANEGERIIHIGPLDESAKLFADRAPHGSVDLERDRAQIESICDALHNLPLAVTVAAAWADRFTLSELKDKLPKIIARDQVIAASNEWSWKLLTDQQRERLARLSFFSGGGRLDDIAAVFGESDELAAAEQLAELRARNWLTLSSQDSPRRYDFDNPLLQEFCSAKMSAEFGGIQVEAQLKHVEHFADVSRAWTEALHGGSAGSQMQAVDRFAMDKPNFDLSYRISVNAKLIRPFSHLRYGYCAYSGVWDFSVAREYYEQALVLHSELGDKQGEANDLHSLGEIARRVDDYPEASDYYERARVLYLGTEDKLGGGNCHYGLGFIAYVQGDHVEAKKRFQEALLLHREIGDELGQANDLAALGEVAILEGDFSAAFICYEQALVLHRGLGNRLGEATALKGLGHAARQQGHYGVSREQYEQALTLYRELRIVIGEANVLNGLGHVACLQSDCDAARACYEQALSLDRMMGNKLGEANNLQGLGDVAQMEGDHAAARTHYKSALSLHRVSGAKQAQANDLFGLGMSSLQEGRWAEGRQELSDALILYEVIGLENLVQWIRQLLDTLPE